MIVGLPKGLLFHQYEKFITEFLKVLQIDYIISKDTNKDILNLGVKYCVDEACLPIKIFHGHVASIKDRCDLVIVPRIVSVHEKEFICPKFNGLPEMILHNIPNMPAITTKPLYLYSEKKTLAWLEDFGSMLNKNKNQVREAYIRGKEIYDRQKLGYNDKRYRRRVLLVGHPYNIDDIYMNMNIKKKLNDLGVGVMTHHYVRDKDKQKEVDKLYKRPFWTFARHTYGSCVYLGRTQQVDGIIYLSSFNCGIDSIFIQLIKNELKDFPLLVVKIDEHTGEAGLNTRLEAYTDMLERKKKNGSNFPASREHLYSM